MPGGSNALAGKRRKEIVAGTSVNTSLDVSICLIDE